MKKEITTFGIQIGIQQKQNQDYFSLTDIAKFKDKSHSDDLIKNWLRNRTTIELLGLWEKLYNPNFKPVEFDGFRKESGLNSFVLTPKKMDSIYQCHRNCFNFRKIRWNVCS
jgi:hypothetical protein